MKEQYKLLTVMAPEKSYSIFNLMKITGLNYRTLCVDLTLLLAEGLITQANKKYQKVI